VSAWRRKALEDFPELRQPLAPGGEIHSFFEFVVYELRPLVVTAHRANNEDLLTRIYNYAEWAHQQSWDLWNTIGISFYEHIFDEPRPLADVVRWLSPRIVQAHRELWRTQLSPARWAHIEQLLKKAPDWKQSDHLLKQR
jgi:hypothetical protein